MKIGHRKWLERNIYLFYETFSWKHFVVEALIIEPSKVIGPRQRDAAANGPMTCGKAENAH